jgi:hypothetical protein
MRRIVASLPARRAAGLCIGRPPVYTMRTLTCPCGATFAAKIYKRGGWHRKLCRPNCPARKRGRDRKIPNDFALLYDLYWNQGESITAIAKRFDTLNTCVGRCMTRLGIPRRKRHQRSTCIVLGCAERAYWSKDQGRRCLAHWAAHRHARSASYWRRVLKWKKRGMGAGRGRDLTAFLESIVPGSLPPDMRAEVTQEMAMRLVDGTVTFAAAKAAVANVTKWVLRTYHDKFKQVSIDAPIGDSDLTLGDLLSDQRSLEEWREFETDEAATA